MPSPAQTQLLDNELTKIRVPRSDISTILSNFDKMAGGIIGGILKPEQLNKITQKIINDPAFRDKFIEDYKSAVKSLGY